MDLKNHTQCEAAKLPSMMMPNSPNLSDATPATLVVSLDDAATMLGICKRTIERERDRGTLKCLRIGRHWKVRVGEIHAYLRRMESESR